MNRKFLLCLLTLFLTISLEAIEWKQPTPKDADLFKKDVPAFSTHGEFIYWSCDEGALDYALTMNGPAWGPNNNYAQGDFKIANYPWDPGFRVSLSYFNAPKFWEISGQYTWLHIEGSDQASNPAEDDRYLTATWAQVIPSPLTSAKSHIHLNHKLGDLTVARIFHPNPHLKLRLLMGIPLAYFYQKWKIDYQNANDNTTQTSLKWKFFGPGLQIGVKGDWFWGNNFYLIGKISTALFIGRYKNYSYQKTNYAPTSEYNTETPFRNAKYKHYRPAYVTQYLIGPSWQKNFTKNRMELFAGYEFNAWFNLHEVFRSGHGNRSAAKETFINRELLILHGLTARLSIDF